MVASKQDIISAYQQSTRRLEGLVAACSPENLKKTAYPGWTAKQLICHMASTSGAAAFFISMAQASGQGMGTGFDVDRWNAEQVAARQEKPLEEVLTEFRAGHEASIKAVEAAPDDLLAKQVPDFSGGMSPLADLIRGSATDHEALHLDDLEKALRG
jgi:uncharacterized protein (TIGR03083 family)